MASLPSATMTGLVITALSTPGIATRRIPGAPVRSSRNGRMVPSGHGDRQHRRGIPRVRSHDRGNDERLAMIRQALETEGGRRVTAGPRLTGADNLRAGRPGSDREADPLCTRPRARQRSRSVSEDSDARAEDAPRSAWIQPTSCRPDRTNDPMQFHMLRPRSVPSRIRYRTRDRPAHPELAQPGRAVELADVLDDRRAGRSR